MKNKRILAMILATTIISGLITGCGTPHEKATKADPTAKALAISGNMDKTDTGTMIMSITADKGWDKESTPAILHVIPVDNESEEFYHAVFANGNGGTGSTEVELEAGTYTVDFVSPLNHDGSAYEVFDMGTAKDITVDIDSDITVDCPMTQIPSDKVTDEMVADIVKATQEAVSKGDDSLKGNAIDTMVNNLVTNVTNSPNASDETKEAAKDVQEAAKKEENAENNKVQSGIKDDKNETVKEDKTNGNSGVQANTGKPESETMADVPSTPVAQPKDTATQAPSDATVQAPSVTQPVETKPSTTQPTETKPVETAPVHTHTWAEHKATKTEWVPNIVTVPNYETQTVYIDRCNGCGATFRRDAAGYEAQYEEHIMNHLLAGEDCNTQCITETTEVQVGSHTEDHGHNETVTYTDYVYCTGCGARQ